MDKASARPFSTARQAFLSTPGISSAQAYLRAAVGLLGALGSEAGYEPALRMLKDARRAVRPNDLLRLVNSAWTVRRG